MAIYGIKNNKSLVEVMDKGTVNSELSTVKKSVSSLENEVDTVKESVSTLESDVDDKVSEVTDMIPEKIIYSDWANDLFRMTGSDQPVIQCGVISGNTSAHTTYTVTYPEPMTGNPTVILQHFDDEDRDYPIILVSSSASGFTYLSKSGMNKVMWIAIQ